jgi:hypothetical protein
MLVHAHGALKKYLSNFCQVCSRWQHRTSGSVSFNECGCWTEWLSVDADVLGTNCLSLANSWNRPCDVTAQAVGDDHSEVCRESHRTTYWTKYCKGKVVPVYSMKAYRGSRGCSPAHSRPALFTPRKEPRYPSNRRLGGSHSSPELFWEERTQWTQLGFEYGQSRR